MSERINVKEAVIVAREFAEQIYGEGEGNELRNLRTEEVEFSAPDNRWFITLAWDDTSYREIPSAEMAGIRYKAPRTSKVFQIDAEQGEVMKMENPEK